MCHVPLYLCKYGMYHNSLSICIHTYHVSLHLYMYVLYVHISLCVYVLHEPYPNIIYVCVMYHCMLFVYSSIWSRPTILGQGPKMRCVLVSVFVKGLERPDDRKSTENKIRGILKSPGC